jgi:hypothetical protein
MGGRFVDTPSEKIKLDIVIELTGIIKELEDIADGLKRDFKNIGNIYCASAVNKVAENYRVVLKQLRSI